MPAERRCDSFEIWAMDEHRIGLKPIVRGVGHPIATFYAAQERERDARKAKQARADDFVPSSTTDHHPWNSALCAEPFSSLRRSQNVVSIRPLVVSGRVVSRLIKSGPVKAGEVAFVASSCVASSRGISRPAKGHRVVPFFFHLTPPVSHLSEAIGQPGSLSAMQGALRAFDGKNFDFSKKVIDNEVGGALRQIIHYSYVEQVGFIYFRFNFKMTSKGWVLANFNFKSESAELFPKDF
jgi:hypothetical protein